MRLFSERGMGAEEEHERLRAERQAALDAILDSAAEKKLIVSGPGTGKTHTFKQALGLDGFTITHLPICPSA